jgi:hypothetical protein
MTEELLVMKKIKVSVSHKDIAVQPTRLFHMKHCHDIMQSVTSIRPFQAVKDKLNHPFAVSFYPLKKTAKTSGLDL